MIPAKYLEILDEPPVMWQAIANNMPEEELREMVDWFQALAARAAMAEAYFERRGGGIADQGHDRAADAARSAYARVRKVMGYRHSAGPAF